MPDNGVIVWRHWGQDISPFSIGEAKEMGASLVLADIAPSNACWFPGFKMAMCSFWWFTAHVVFGNGLISVVHDPTHTHDTF